MMIEFDEYINNCVSSRNGIYRRYSDDFFIFVLYLVYIDFFDSIYSTFATDAVELEQAYIT